MSKQMSPEHEVAISRFWERFIKRIHELGITEPSDRWYKIRAQRYIDAYPDKRLLEHGVSDLTTYLNALGRKPGLEDWQFRQAVDAIRILLAEITGLVWARSFDWTFWMESARTLESSHPTVARDYSELPAGKSSEQRRYHDIKAAYPALFKRLTNEIRRRGYSIRTEQSYESWVCRCIGFHGGGNPASLGTREVVTFLEHLAVQRKVAASTQNLALNALVFWFHHVLQQPLGDMGGFVRAKRSRHLPIVLTREEVRSLLKGLHGVHQLMVGLLYGSGLRLMECIRLRVQDVDFGYRQIVVRGAKGGKDRIVPLPERFAAGTGDAYINDKDHA